MGKAMSNHSTAEFIAQVVQIALLLAGVLALIFYWRQAWAARRDHISNVYRLAFEKLDSHDVRDARHYIYAMDMIRGENGKRVERKPDQLSELTFEVEHWLELDSGVYAAKDCSVWKEHKDKAELVARTLDQLGFLVREGVVPLNIIARFYSYPALRCWYKLIPYVNAVRKDRGQKGHMWEWEKLVGKVMEGVRPDKGLWKGSRDHDNLGKISDDINARTVAIGLVTDTNWNCPDHSWAYMGIRERLKVAIFKN
jgi:hypothetical protein